MMDKILTQKQVDFLREFDLLLAKYSVDKIIITGFNSICFYSNGEILLVSGYTDGVFDNPKNGHIRGWGDKS